jgi:signal transduction histidine kinase
MATLSSEGSTVTTKGVESGGGTAAERPRILVIDDELGPRESVRFLFKNTHEVHCASSVAQGIELLRQTRPDIVVMDIRMPDRNGIDGLREVRAIDPNVSVVMLTGFGTLDTAQDALRLGASDYLKKPFDIQEMRSLVERYIERTRIARKRSETVEALRQLNDRLQSELAQKDDLVNLGQASSAFVHDLRNPLFVVCGYLELLMSRLDQLALGPEDSREVLRYMDIIAKNVNRCQEMTQTWRSAVRADPSRMKPCRIADIVADVEGSSDPLLRPCGGALRVVPGPMDCRVLADSVQLYRAVQNLVGNAIQALPPSNGVVEVRWRVESNVVVIEVEDNGGGIPESVLGALFEAGKTTKAESGGMGLGLFVTRRIVEGHMGTVSLANRPPPAKGAIAAIRLPLLV